MHNLTLKMLKHTLGISFLFIYFTIAQVFQIIYS
jgi:hypothetical protein